MEISPTAHIRPPFWWVRWVPIALLIAGLITLTIVIGGKVLVPLLVSFALAFMLEPLADWFQRRSHSRSAAVLLTLGSAALMVALLLYSCYRASTTSSWNPSRNCRLLCAPWPRRRNIYWVSPGSG